MAAEVGAILLAAGSSRRMGAANKLLIEVDGTPIVARAAAAIAEAGLPLIVVLGHEAGTVRAALSPSPANPGEGLLQPIVLHAPDHTLGMGHSLAAAIAAIPPSWTGALVCLGDMPFITADLLRRIAAALTVPTSVAVPVHAGRRGNPVGWGRAWFPHLAALTGDAGGRALLAATTPTEIAADRSVHADFDTPQAFADWHAGGHAVNAAPHNRDQEPS